MRGEATVGGSQKRHRDSDLAAKHALDSRDLSWQCHNDQPLNGITRAGTGDPRRRNLGANFTDHRPMPLTRSGRYSRDSSGCSVR